MIASLSQVDTEDCSLERMAILRDGQPRGGEACHAEMGCRERMLSDC